MSSKNRYKDKIQMPETTVFAGFCLFSLNSEKKSDKMKKYKFWNPHTYYVGFRIIVFSKKSILDEVIKTHKKNRTKFKQSDFNETI